MCDSRPFQQAIALNNHAAFLIEQANHKAALTALTSARQKIRHVSANFLPCSKSHQDFANQSRCRLDQLMDLRCVTEPVSESCDDGHEEFVYPSPIHTPSNMATDHQSQAILAIAIIFNTALASHLIALQQNKDQSNVLLKKALKLYKLSFELHRNAQASTRLSAMLYMATINNSGQIYRLLGKQEAAGTCFRQLFSTLMYLGYADQADGRKLQGFYRSTSIWISQEGRIETAAAA
jgi:tetratricopeptide (TPR) repeat protein